MTVVQRGKIRPEIVRAVNEMLLDVENDTGAQDLAVDFSANGGLRHAGKNPPLCHLYCIG